MVGVIYACSLDDPESIQTSWEHSEIRWVTLTEAKSLLPGDHWLIELIERAETMRSLMPDALLSYFKSNRI